MTLLPRNSLPFSSLVSFVALLAVLLGIATPSPAVARSIATPAPQGGGSFTTDVVFGNRSYIRRNEWATATVPFPPGVWTAGKSFGTSDVPAELQPFGATWPDGSVRYARLTARVDLREGTDRRVRIREGNFSLPAFRYGPWVQARLPQFELSLIVGLPGGRIETVTMSPHQTLETTNARRTTLFRGRVPGSDLVYDLWLTFFADQDHAKFELRLTNSKVGSQAWRQNYDFIVLASQAATPWIRGSRRLGVLQTTPDASGPNYAMLLRDTFLYDGQAHDWHGELSFYDPAVRVPDATTRLQTMVAAYDWPLWGISTDWDRPGVFGPFGHLPPAPSWMNDGGRGWAKARLRDFRNELATPAEPFADRRFGLVKHAGNTGDQYDFGAAKLVGTFRSALPDTIEEARWNGAEEAFRPVHYREANGEPVRARNHPDWVPWSGRSHFNRTVCPDRLGKPFPEPFLGSAAHGWSGKDNQHWSGLTLASAALLTSSFSLMAEIDNDIELYIASHTLPSQKPGWASNGMDAPRAVGRTYLTMSWFYLVTGRADIAQRMRDRVDQCVAVQYHGTRVTGPVKPMSVSGPDPRVLLRDFWFPWQEAQAIMGLEACFRVTGSMTAHTLAVHCAQNLIEYGWRVDSNGTVPGVGIAWLPNGQALTPAQYLDPNYVLWSYGTAFDVWSLPAVKLAARYGMLYGDSGMMMRSLMIQQRLEAGRPVPRDRGFDRFYEWDTVQ